MPPAFCMRKTHFRYVTDVSVHLFRIFSASFSVFDAKLFLLLRNTTISDIIIPDFTRF